MIQKSQYTADVAIECDVAVVGPGPVGLMTANLHGAAVFRIADFKREDARFIAGAEKQGVCGALVRPDRLDAGVDLAVLNLFAIAPSAALPRAA